MPVVAVVEQDEEVEVEVDGILPVACSDAAGL
jgi:hypothetical protein